MKRKFFERKLEKRIKRFAGRKEIIGIRGARQTGKTTLLKMIEGGIRGQKAFINMDLPEYRRALEGDALDFVKRFKKPGKRLFLLLDEVQRVKDVGEKLKIIFDEFPDVKMFITGSSSLELKANVMPPLVGRLFLFELFTFDFEEFLSTRDEGLQRLFKEKHAGLKRFLEGKGKPAPPSFGEDFLKYWKEYAVFGGYPEVVKSRDKTEKVTILRNIFNLYLERDIINFFRIEEASKFEDLLKALSFNISNLLLISSLASELDIGYKKIEEFLTILQHTYTIQLLKPFHRNLVTELKKSPKAYFLDLGLRNSVIDNFLSFDKRADKAQLMEDFVLRELLANFGEWKINYWRTTGKAEVDFVLRKGEEVIPIEVKLGGEKVGKSFYSFLNTYKPRRAVIVTLDRFGWQKIGRTLLYRIPVFYF